VSPRRCVAVVAIAATAALTACNTKVHQVRVDPSRLDSTRSMPALRCGYRLVEVADERPGGGVGGLGRHQLILDDAPAMVDAQLRKAGLKAADSAGLPGVSVRLKQLYLTQNQTTKVPVAVYQASIDGQPPFLVRASKSSINWNGTENEAYSALATALLDANVQLFAALNTRCPAAG